MIANRERGRPGKPLGGDRWHQSGPRTVFDSGLRCGGSGSDNLSAEPRRDFRCGHGRPPCKSEDPASEGEREIEIASPDTGFGSIRLRSCCGLVHDGFGPPRDRGACVAVSQRCSIPLQNRQANVHLFGSDPVPALHDSACCNGRSACQPTTRQSSRQSRMRCSGTLAVRMQRSNSTSSAFRSAMPVRSDAATSNGL